MQKASRVVLEPDHPLNLPPKERFSLLDTMAFTASDLTHTMVRADNLTNYLRKNRFELASQTEGKGKARTFCLLDVYQIALLQELAKLTKQTNVCARALESFFFAELIAALPERS